MLHTALFTAALLGALPSASQGEAPEAGARHGAPPDTLVLPLPHLAGHAEDRFRLDQLLGRAPTDGFLLRSPSTLLDAVSGETSPPFSSFSWSFLAPELHLVHNSDLPFSLNEGALWAGRGLNVRVTTGARIRWGPATLIVAPHYLLEQNQDFQTIAYPEITGGRVRHRLATPFHYPPGSADLPQRFGYESRSRWDPGQSSLTVRAGPVAFGAATENLWWGPGVRNALLLSSQAPGFPHLFLRTARPLETGWGALEGRWILGRLDESDFFDFDPGNDRRSISALALVFSPAFDPELSVGVARAVYAPAGPEFVPVSAAFDVLSNVGRPWSEGGGAEPPAERGVGDPEEGLLEPGPDQVFSLFWRWAFPGAGFEFYGEWARFAQPENLRDFLELPQHSRGYTVGLQYAREAPLGWIGGEETLRIQAEITSLEPGSSYRVRPFSEWYASRRVPQGYTHEGRVLGAAVGPSGSSQWLAADLFGRGWWLGLFGGRIRWDNQAQFTYFSEFRRADVTLFGGLRGGADVGPVRMSAEYGPSVRLNYLFQAQPLENFRERGVDLRNRTLKLTVEVGRGW